MIDTIAANEGLKMNFRSVDILSIKKRQTELLISIINRLRLLVRGTAGSLVRGILDCIYQFGFTNISTTQHKDFRVELKVSHRYGHRKILGESRLR